VLPVEAGEPGQEGPRVCRRRGVVEGPQQVVGRRRPARPRPPRRPPLVPGLRRLLRRLRPELLRPRLPLRAPGVLRAHGPPRVPPRPGGRSRPHLTAGGRGRADRLQGRAAGRDREGGGDRLCGPRLDRAPGPRARVAGRVTAWRDRAPAAATRRPNRLDALGHHRPARLDGVPQRGRRRWRARVLAPRREPVGDAEVMVACGPCGPRHVWSRRTRSRWPVLTPAVDAACAGRRIGASRGCRGV
jgi:hypothetical protein